MDDVAWHHSPPIHDVLAASRIHHEIKKMPPYSPHLNAIEYVFSKWKSEVKEHDQTTATLCHAQLWAPHSFLTPQSLLRVVI